MRKAALVFAMIALVGNQSSDAQIFGTGPDKPSVEFIPRSAVAGAAVFPKKLAANPNFKAFPHEVVTAWGKKELGFDPMLITEVTFILRKIEPFNGDNPSDQQPGWAAVLHFEEMQGLSGAMIDQLEKKSIGGKTVFSGIDGGPSFMVFDESTLIIGNETWFSELITTPRQGELVEMFANPEVTGQWVTFANIKEMRPILTEIFKAFDDYELPSQVADFRQIPNLVDALEIGLDLDGKIESKLLVHAANPDAAQRVSDIVAEGMQYGKVALLAQVTSQLDLEDPVQAATLAYTRRVAEKYEAKLTPTINGSDLTVTLNEEILALPVLLGMVGSMTQSMEFERKMTPELQLRETALAFHNYTDAYGKFPATTINNENGKPLFSGRVAILPFLEQNALYSQLRLDEPWDSEHNSELTSVVIPTYGMNANGNATVMFPVFPGSIWDDGGGKSFRDVIDGTSNTILAIQVPDGSTISWADPKPWEISESDPMRDVFGDRDEVVVAMADGSSRVLKRAEMTNEKLKAMLTIAGGEVIDR